MAQRQAPNVNVEQGVIGNDTAYFLEYEGRAYGVYDFNKLVVYVIKGNMMFTITGVIVPKDGVSPSESFFGQRYEEVFNAMAKSLAPI